MRTIKIISILTFLFLFFPFKSDAQISFGNYSGYYKYCVVPPYVKRDVKPNILVIMDNAKGMGGAAYTDYYDPTKIYSGYFRYDIKYTYNSNRFEPDVNGIYSGNILNWVLTSKYDLLQSILVGGISASRTSNPHTLISYSESWTKTLKYNNNDGFGVRSCIFEVNNGNLIIKDETPGSCGYLDTPPRPFNPTTGFIITSIYLLNRADKILFSYIKNIIDYLNPFYVSEAHSAKPVAIAGGSSTLPSGTECNSYSTTITASGGTIPYIWSISSGSLPPGLSITSGTPSATISGVPTTSGTYSFTVRVTDSTGGTDTKTFSITINDATVSINTTSPLQDAYVGSYYYVPLSATSACSSSYTWTLISGSLPPSFSITGGNAIFSTSPTTAGTYNFTLRVTDSGGNTAQRSYTLTVNPPLTSLVISSGSPLQSGTVGVPYFIYIETPPGSGVSPFTWSYTGGLPPGLSFGYGSNYYTSISGTPLTAGTYNFTIKVTDNSGATASKNFVLTINPSPIPIRTGSSMSVKICVGDYIKNCSNTSNDTKLKSGIINDFWAQARFGLMDFNKQAGNAIPNLSECINTSGGTEPDPNFLTAIENAVPIDPTTTLVNALYTAIDYYKNNIASNCNPYREAPACLKSYILVITDGTGANVGTNIFSDLSNCGSSSYYNLTRNTCYGFSNDLRSSIGGKQNVNTYIVNTMGTNDAILKQATDAGGGVYYKVSDPSTLKQTLKQAFQDIIKRAASGTAASVLASGEGSGANLIQAVFYPTSQTIIRGGNFDREITWIGRVQNLWYYVDPFFNKSSIREDTQSDYILNLTQDYITDLYFDPIAEQTKAKRWADTDGDGLPNEIRTEIKLEDVKNLWEAGLELWKRDISSSPRALYTTLNGSSLISFSVANKSYLRALLNVSDDDQAEALIRYVNGEDTPTVNGITYSNFRSRKVAIDLNGDGDVLDSGEEEKIWKLGDVINSTPKILSFLPQNNYYEAYQDVTYREFINTTNYKNRGLVLVGANDGMLHAFKLGKLELNWSGKAQNQVARLSGSDKGKEIWAYIPQNALPYLISYADPGYCHINSVDLTPHIVDASIGTTGCSEPNYWDCPKTVASWRTIVIGGMRLGGATANLTSTCSDCVKTPINNVGYSSYFALDVTDPENPALLWEFSHPELGYSFSGPAIIRIGARDNSGAVDNSKNGRWYVVFSSGPTGPIDKMSMQNLAKSNQPWKIFILDLKTGQLLRKIVTDRTNAFGGRLTKSTIDADLDYQDDALYLPYARLFSGIWYGGIYRLFTKESLDVNQWALNPLITGLGPVVGGIGKLVNNKTGKLWIYAGTGRYFFETGSVTDDADTQRGLFGFKDPCFSVNSFDLNCTATVSVNDLVDATNSEPSDVSVGWKILLDTSDANYKAERVVSDVNAQTNGVVFFNTFKPYVDECSIGGKTYMWAVKYETGGSAVTRLKGIAIIQLSTGAITQINLSQAFTQKLNRRSESMEGVTSEVAAGGFSSPAPVKRVLHIRQR